MTQSTSAMSAITVGLDVGDKNTHFCALDGERKVLKRGSFPTRRGNLEQALLEFPGAKVVLEAGSQSPWMARVLRGRGLRVQIANPRRVQLISKDPRKTDRRDAEMLARLGAAMPEVLGEIYHRGEQAQAHLAIVRARDLVVRMRTMAVQQARSICKAFGVRLPSKSTRSFGALRPLIPALLLPALDPILDLIAASTQQINTYEKSLSGIAKEHYPEVQHLQQVGGVGPVIATAFVLTVEDASRFDNSRAVGSWLGLCPRSQASGDSNPQLRISKAGDPRLRRLLVQGAQWILGPFGTDCDLRRYGLRLAARGGKAPKKRAVVAVARKLAILLHRLWATRAVYEPLRNANRQVVAATV